MVHFGGLTILAARLSPTNIFAPASSLLIPSVNACAELFGPTIATRTMNLEGREVQ
jgi:hypothetical protein